MAFSSDIKIGVLGGGQLGRMLVQSAMDFNLDLCVLDPDPEAPCNGLVKDFQIGKLTDYDTVYQWGKDKDLITIEIENVNLDALEKLEAEGKKIFPQPRVIRIIQDKRIQKQFYREHNIPTSDFVLVDGKDHLHQHVEFLPAFQKLGKGGYDGKGVQRMASAKDFEKALDGPGLLEKLVDFEKEISVIVARNESGDIVTFPSVEMVFHPVHNLVEFQFSPAEITKDLEAEAKAIAIKIIEKLGMVGLLAVEMFLTKDGKILVNEVAPRPHNSGHQTIEGNLTSQYEQHLRSILGLPLGDTASVMISAMVNLLGEAGYNGPAKYEGADQVLGLKGVYLHLYGKSLTKPFRKMGHVSILDDSVESIRRKADYIKNTLKVIA
jgi:5-(carboxyamino)imidazole ribonucleotide synthase